jgi:glucose/arabinose dehydrogenase
MTKNLINRLLLCCMTFVLLMSPGAYAQLPAAFIQKKLTGDDIQEAVQLAHAPDGRIFIAERDGDVKVLQNGVVTTVHTVTTTTAAEQGLLGITLHPQFATNGRFYIFYTDPNATVHYLDMVTINTANQVTASTRVMQFDPIINGAHNGGALLFKGGFLYVAIGESNSPEQATILDTYRGKILRLTEDGQPAPGNPYYDETNATRQKRSIWAIGMRNPWKMSVDPLSGKIFVVNVGGDYEEINDVTSPDPAKNYNYGWDQNGRSGPQQAANTILPVFAYAHDGWGCAITSGVFFNPPVTKWPAQYRNRFYFSDWCSEWFRSIDATNPDQGGYQEFAATGFGSILGTSVGVDGNLYYAKYGTNGSIWRIEYDTTQLPKVVNQPASQTVFAADTVRFSVNASGAQPFTYQWQKNDVNIANATSNIFSIANVAQADSGHYRCIVSNSAGTDTSVEATLTVKPFDAKPVPHITKPLSSFTWSVGDPVAFSGTATDPEDGAIPVAKYHWEVRFYHEDNPQSLHYHPGPVIPDGIANGTFTADNLGETSPNVWLRILLTVTDSQGRTGTDSVDIQPNKVVLTADANIPGLQLVLGTQGTAPFSKTFVVNTAFTLQAITPQVIDTGFYEFGSWSNGGAAEQNLHVPAANTTYKATYNRGANAQNPFHAQPADIPGKIEAEDFDLGGEGIAYHDTGKGNAGNQYRTKEDVDIEPCAEGTYDIAYVATGEWLEYTINVTTPGVYTFSARVANPGDPKTIHMELDGQNISGAITVPTTGGFQNYQTVSFNTPALSAGVKVLRVSLDAADVNLNYYTFALANGGGSNPIISLTSPANNSTFTAQSDVEIDANATALQGNIANVEFYQGGTKLGEDATAPYEYTWMGVTAGTYTLTAKATDSNGQTTISSPVTITVTGNTGSGSNNLALHKTPVASGEENGGTPAVNATDGDYGTRFSSNFSDTAWIYVDLGATYNISEVKIFWEDARGKDYDIQLADQPGNWHTIRSVRNNDSLTNDLAGLSGTGRYIRMQGVTRFRPYGYSIYEFEVYGSAAATARVAATKANTSKVFKVYPNPVYTTLTIDGLTKDGICTIINVATSRATKQQSINGKLDVSALSAGTYILQFKEGNQLISRKFVKL